MGGFINDDYICSCSSGCLNLKRLEKQQKEKNIAAAAGERNNLFKMLVF